MTSRSTGGPPICTCVKRKVEHPWLVWIVFAILFGVAHIASGPAKSASSVPPMAALSPSPQAPYSPQPLAWISQPVVAQPAGSSKKCQQARTVVKGFGQMNAALALNPVQIDSYMVGANPALAPFQGQWLDGIPSETFDGSDPDDYNWQLVDPELTYLSNNCGGS